MVLIFHRDLKYWIAIILVGIFAYQIFSEVIAPQIMPKTQCPPDMMNNESNLRQCIPKTLDVERIESMRPVIGFLMVFVAACIVFGVPVKFKKKK